MRRPATLILCLFTAVVFSTSLQGAEEHSELNAEYFWDQFVKFFNFALLITALYFVLRKPIKQFFLDRARRIDESIEAAQKARQESEQKLKEVEQQVGGLQKEIEETKQKAREEGEAEKQRIINSARAEAERMLENAKTEIENRIKAGRKELKAYAAELAVERAKQLIEERISAEDDRRLIKSFLDDIGVVQ